MRRDKNILSPVPDLLRKTELAASTVTLQAGVTTGAGGFEEAQEETGGISLFIK